MLKNQHKRLQSLQPITDKSLKTIIAVLSSWISRTAPLWNSNIMTLLIVLADASPMTFSDGFRYPKIEFFRVCTYPKAFLEMDWRRIFFFFCHIFVAFHYEKSLNVEKPLAKNEENSCSTCFQPIYSCTTDLLKTR